MAVGIPTWHTPPSSTPLTPTNRSQILTFSLPPEGTARVGVVRDRRQVRQDGFDGRLGPRSLSRRNRSLATARIARFSGPMPRLPDAGEERFLKSVVEGEGEDYDRPSRSRSNVASGHGGSGGRLDLAARRAALPFDELGIPLEGAQPGSRAASATSTGNPAASRRDCRRARKHPMSPRGPDP